MTTATENLLLRDVCLYDGLPSSMSRSLDLRGAYLEADATAADVALAIAEADIICGETYAHRAAFKAAGCWFSKINGTAVWLAPRDSRKAIYALLKRCQERDLRATMLVVGGAL